MINRLRDAWLVLIGRRYAHTLTEWDAHELDRQAAVQDAVSEAERLGGSAVNGGSIKIAYPGQPLWCWSSTSTNSTSTNGE